MRKCIKTRFSPIQMVKHIYFKNIILMVWKYAQMQQKTPDGKKQVFKKQVSNGLELYHYASKHVFHHSRWKKYLF